MSDRLIFAICLTLPLLINLYLRQPLFRPSGLMAAVWCGTLLGAEVFAPDFIFSDRAGWISTAIVGSFVLGDYCSLRAEGKGRFQGELVVARLRTVTLVLGILSVAGSIAYMLAFVRYFGSVIEYFAAGWSVREAWAAGDVAVPFVVRSVALLGYAGGILALVAWTQVGFRTWMLPAFLGVLLFGLAQFGRAGSVLVAIEAFFMAYLRDVSRGARADRRLLVRLVPAAAIVVALFLGGEAIRILSGFEWETSVRSFYVYAFSGPSALTEFLHSSRIGSEPEWGAASFDSLAAAIGVKQQLVGVYDTFAEVSAREPDIGNVYTFVRPTLEDFGLLGGCAFMFVVGWLSGVAFGLARRGFLPALAISCAMAGYIAFSVITPPTVFNSWLVSLILPPFVVLWALRRPTDRDSSPYPSRSPSASG